ncbi:uncharacterized protein LOC141596165 isoform X2 [Silene latifolia]
MDTYEECHEPPRLQLLDRFDTGGSGSCLKRYSDPTFFRRASATSEARNREKSQRERKTRKFKGRSWRHSERFSSCVPSVNNSERVQISSQAGSSLDRTFRSDLGDQSDSFSSKISVQPDKTTTKELPDTRQTNYHSERISVDDKGLRGKPPCSDVTWDEKLEVMEHMDVNYEAEDDQHTLEKNNILHQQDMKPDSTESINQVDDISENGSITKSETDQKYTEMKPNNITPMPEGLQQTVRYPTTIPYWEDMELSPKDSGLDNFRDLDESNVDLHEPFHQTAPFVSKSINQVDNLSENGSTTTSEADCLYEQRVKTVDAKSSQADNVSEVTSCSESDADGHYLGTTINGKFIEASGPSHLHETDVKPVNVKNLHHVEGVPEHDKDPTTIIDWDTELSHKDCGINDVRDLDETNFDLHEPFSQVTRFSEGQNSHQECDLALETIPDSFPQIARFLENENFPMLIPKGNFVSDPLDSKLRIGDVQYMLEAIEKDKWAIETIEAKHVGTSSAPVAELSKVENPLQLVTNDKFASGLSETNIEKSMLDAGTIIEEYDGPVDTSTGVNNASLLEWPYPEDIDSETDYFVDALNTIDSESESEYETQTIKELESLTSKCELLEDASTAQKDGVIDVWVQPNAPLYLTNLDNLEDASTSECKLLEDASTAQKDGVYDVFVQPNAPLYLTNVENLENTVESHQSEGATIEEGDPPPCFSNEQSFESPPSVPTVSQGIDVCVKAAEIRLQPAVSKPVESPPSLPTVSQGIDVCVKAAETRLQPAVSKPVESPPSLPTVSQGTDVCINAAEIRLQPAVSKPVESSSQDSLDDKTVCAPPHVSGDMPLESSTSSYPYASWTNGTLFGLQPSKPPVTSMSNSDLMSCGNGHVDDVPGRFLSSSVRNYDHDGNFNSNKQDVGSLKHVSHDVLHKKRDKSLDHDERNRNDDSALQDLSNGHVNVLESKVPSNADSENLRSATTNTTEDRSSLLSLLGQNLRKSGLRRSGSLDSNVEKTPNNPLPASVDEKSQVSANSPPPSPPLELMKISFRPIDGLETSKLKLKYPEGIDHHESSIETFPSFQLVPESSRLHHDMGSDSDDDTFCRSYPCDDSLGHLSDSGSEQWESEDSSESNDHASYDGLRRISSTESPSSSPQHDEISQRGIPTGPTGQSTILGTKIGYAEMKACLSPGVDIMPQLPPLPPLEWRVSRTLLDGVEDKPEQGPDRLNRSFDSHHLNDSAILQGRFRESDTIVKQKKPGAEPKERDQKQKLYAADEKNVDDKEDFLNQIRAKSFNLKRTDTARSLYTTPSLPTSTKVTAILQKASAIRKAVGSDGEDDSWSDT